MSEIPQDSPYLKWAILGFVGVIVLIGIIIAVVFLSKSSPSPTPTPSPKDNPTPTPTPSPKNDPTPNPSGGKITQTGRRLVNRAYPDHIFTFQQQSFPGKDYNEDYSCYQSNDDNMRLPILAPKDFSKMKREVFLDKNRIVEQRTATDGTQFGDNYLSIHGPGERGTLVSGDSSQEYQYESGIISGKDLTGNKIQLFAEPGKDGCIFVKMEPYSRIGTNASFWDFILTDK